MSKHNLEHFCLKKWCTLIENLKHLIWDGDENENKNEKKIGIIWECPGCDNDFKFCESHVK